MDYIQIMKIIYNFKNKFNIIIKLCKEDIKMKIHFGLKPFIIKLIKNYNTLLPKLFIIEVLFLLY